MPVKWSEVYESTGDLHQTICEAKNADFIFLMKSSYAKSEKNIDSEMVLWYYNYRKVSLFRDASPVVSSHAVA